MLPAIMDDVIELPDNTVCDSGDGFAHHSGTWRVTVA